MRANGKTIKPTERELIRITMGQPTRDGGSTISRMGKARRPGLMGPSMTGSTREVSSTAKECSPGETGPGMRAISKRMISRETVRIISLLILMGNRYI